MSAPEPEVGAFVVLRVRVEVIERYPTAECPECGFDSLESMLAVLMTGESIIAGPEVYARCGRGCTDDQIVTTRGHGPDG